MKRLLILFLTVGFTFSAYPHAGEDHGPKVGDAGATTGPITLAVEAVKNLGIQSVEAKIEPLQATLSMVARIEPLPEKDARITARFEGRVLEILAKIGETVKVGQPLLKLDPRQIGNPPVTLRSPIDGAITAQNLTIGQTFSADTVLMEVSDNHKMLARGTTYENSDLGKIKVGQEARVVADIFPGETFIGKVQRLDVGIERESRTFEVFALLDNDDLKLKPNLQASMHVGLGDSQEVLSVPARALLGDTGNYFVFVQDKETFEKRAVVLGIKAGDRVEILEGIFPGEQVVVQGNYQLQFAKGKPKPATSDTHAASSPKQSGKWWKWLLGIVVIVFGVVIISKLFRRRSPPGPWKPNDSLTVRK